MRLLVTRPMPQAEETAAELRARGHEATLDPLSEIALIADADIPRRPFQAILATSRHGIEGLAVRADAAHFTPLPLHVVGARTAQAARDLGFRDLVSADGAATDLASLVSARLTPRAGPLLYATAATRKPDLEAMLAASGFDVVVVETYRVIARTLSAATVDALRTRTLDGVLHFSAGAASAFMTQAARLDSKELGALAHYCLSAEVADAVAAHGPARVMVAARPNAEAMIALLGAAP